MDIKNLIDIAKNSDALSDSEFDTFLRSNHYDVTDLSERILVQDLFLFYSFYYYKKHKAIPHRKQFTEGSEVFKQNKIRQRKQTDKTKLTWGLKCSIKFKETFNQWQEENQDWEKRIKDVRNGKRVYKQRRKYRNQNKKLDTQIESLLDLIKHTSVK